ncbi:hypothetical protein [Saccharomonospora sp. CUA-673]|uniref:hypothetical protein n=1 Tax=Saccharomonospora sp. CUA-673 TaxID=1904969 RepID=UPI0035158625
MGRARVELTTIRRMGRDQPVLEIEPRQAFDDVDPGMLTVLGWLELGADPRDVHDELEALRR